MARGRDKVTKADVDAFLAEYRRVARTSSAPKRGFDAQIKGVKSFQTQLEYAPPSRGGQARYTLGKGKNYNEITDPKTREYLDSTRRIDAEAAALGKPRKEKKSWFNRTVDVLSRGNFASAEAFKEAFDPKTKAFWEPKEGLKGFWSGLQGKEKTTFKKVLEQHGHTGKGMGTLGFALDVVADPLTWTGVGLATKPLKAKAAVDQLNELGRVASVAKKSNNTQVVDQALQTHLAPVGAIRKGITGKGRDLKKLTPEGRQVYDFAVDAQRASRGNFVDHAVKKFRRTVEPKMQVDLSGFSDDVLRKVGDEALEAELKAFPGFHGIVNSAKVVPDFKNLDSTAIAMAFPKGYDALGPRVEYGKVLGDTKGAKDLLDRSGAKPDGRRWWSTIGPDAKVEDIMRHNIVHEMGHQATFHLDETVRSEILDAARAKFRGKVDPDSPEGLSAYGNDIPEGGWEFMAEAWAEFRLAGPKARPIAKFVGEEMAKRMPKAPTPKETAAIIKEMAKRHTDRIAPGWAPDLADIQRKAFEEDLLTVTARNIDGGKMKKQFQLKLGPTSVGIPLVAEGATKALSKVATIPGIKQSVDKFNELFRATAHIPPGLDHLRAQQQGVGLALMTQTLKSLEFAFGSLKKAERAGLLKALRDGALEGNAVKGGVDLYGQPIPDMVKYIKTQIDAMDASRMQAGITVEELNAFLGGKSTIRESGLKTRTKKIQEIDEFGRKYTKEVTETTRELTPDLISRAILNNPTIDDPAQALYLYSSALNQAIAKRDLWTTISNTHGVPVGDLGNQLAKDHGWVKVENIKGAEDFLFPPEVAEGMQKIATVFSDQRTTGQFIDQYDRALQAFKGVVTRYNPSFHPRTFMGEMLLGYMGGMKNIPRSYKKAGQVIAGRNDQFLITNAGETADMFAKDAPAALKQASNILRSGGQMSGLTGTAADGSKTVIQRKFGKQTTLLSADKIWHLYLESGLKSGFASTDLVSKNASPLLSGKMATASKMMQSVTEGVEDYGRLAHFIDILQHSKAKTLEEAVEEATRVTRKFHLDYTSVTKFERNVMTRAAPFYKWIRLSTPLMAEILLTKPGKALLVPKAMRDISEMAGYDPDNFGPFPGGADAVVPEWLRDQGAVPWMEYAGNTNYFSPSALFPLAGSADLAESGGFKAASPFFKWGSDIYQGQDKFGNQLRGEAANTKDRIHYAASQTPQTNFLEQVITKRDPGIPREQSIVQFLANLGNQPNTEKRMRGEAFRQRQEAASNRKAAKKEAEKRQGFIK